MQKIGSKTFAIMIAAILAISMTTSIMLLPGTSAHSPAWQIPTYMFLAVSPNPIGVGQSVNINFWVNCPPPTAAGLYGDRWHNMKVTITKPDGTTETLEPFTSDATGGAWTAYTPNQVGNYTFQASWPGETLAGANGANPNNAYIGDYFQPSESAIFTLSVQQEPISPAFVNPLPTEYWARPIYATNNNWYTIAGNWLGLGISTFANTGMYAASGNYAPYTTAPNSAHIMWTKPVAFGGTAGGEFGGSEQSNYWSTSQYQPKFAPIIIQDVLYYTKYPGSSANPAGWEAVNLHTGETIWTKNTTAILRCGQINHYLSINEYGARAYLWATGSVPGVTSTGTTYSMYDAMTGNYILSIVNSTTLSPITIDEHGYLIGYYVNATGTQRLLTMWNSTRAILRGPSGTGDPNSQQWRPTQDAQIPFSNGIQWSAPTATNMSSGEPISLGISAVNSGVVLMTQSSSSAGAFQLGWQIEAGYSSDDGHLLWAPVNRTLVQNSRIISGATSAGYGYYVQFDSSALTATGYSLTTGKQLWGPMKLPNISPYSSLGQQNVVAEGVIYDWTYGGDVYAINMEDGKILWEYHSESGGYESPYGVQPLWTFTVGTVADGKLFVPEGHMYSPPLFRNARQLALNLTDGSIVWKISAFDVTSAPAIVDGVMVTLNAYDNQLYAWGKGPVKMTVTAPDIGVTTATQITIRGTINDISAGADQEVQAARFPNGLPCVSDESQQAWMEYVYMQQPRPNTVTGVPISIDVIDSNGNYRNIGTTTSDASGMFTFAWTPDIVGAYTVIANFAGSESYYPSSAESSFHATDPAPTSGPTGVPLQSVADTYFVPAVIAIIVAIAIGFAITILMLRKRPYVVQQ